MQEHLHATTLEYAYHIAQMCRDWRMTYGYKIISPWLTAMAWQAAFVFLRDMHMHLQPQDGRRRGSHGTNESTAANIELAFEE